jgi:hypothetical protein
MEDLSIHKFPIDEPTNFGFKVLNVICHAIGQKNSQVSGVATAEINNNLLKSFGSSMSHSQVEQQLKFSLLGHRGWRRSIQKDTVYRHFHTLLSRQWS